MCKQKPSRCFNYLSHFYRPPKYFFNPREQQTYSPSTPYLSLFWNSPPLHPHRVKFLQLVASAKGDVIIFNNNLTIEDTEIKII